MYSAVPMTKFNSGVGNLGSTCISTDTRSCLSASPTASLGSQQQLGKSKSSLASKNSSSSSSLKPAASAAGAVPSPFLPAAPAPAPTVRAPADPLLQRYKLNLKLQTLKPGYYISGSRVETRRFQAMCQLDSTSAPPCETHPRAASSSSSPSAAAETETRRAVAVQVEFEAQTLKPRFCHLIGSRVGSPGAFKLLLGQLD
jgi:hypothetical protein